MPQIVLVRRIQMPLGNRDRAIQWFHDTEDYRRQMGQVSQYFLKGITDPNEYLLVQIWKSQDAYEHWQNSAERQRLVGERRRLLTHGPVEFFELL